MTAKQRVVIIPGDQPNVDHMHVGAQAFPLITDKSRQILYRQTQIQTETNARQ